MRRNVLIAIVFWLLLGVAGVNGQTAPLTKAKFDRIIAAAYAKTATRHRREVTTANKFVAGKVVERELTTQDYAPPDKERWIILSNTAEKRTQIEIVYIGDVEFRREEKGEWKKTEGANTNFQMTAVPNPPKRRAKRSVSYSQEETTNAKGIKLRVFTERSKAGSTLQTRTITVDAEDLILKVEELVSEGSPENIVFKSVLLISYSSHPINIEAPIK